MTNARIDIDMDRACARCGRKGAANGGLCLDCAIKRLGERAGMEFKGVNVTASKVDLVSGKGTIGFTLNMEDLLLQRDRLRDWADGEVPLVLSLTPMQPPLEGFEMAEGKNSTGHGQRQIPNEKAGRKANGA